MVENQDNQNQQQGQNQQSAQESIFMTKEDLMHIDDDIIDIGYKPISNTPEPIQVNKQQPELQRSQEHAQPSSQQSNNEQNAANQQQNSSQQDDFYFQPFKRFAELNNVDVDESKLKEVVNKDNWVDVFIESVASAYDPKALIEQSIHPVLLNAQNLLAQGKSWDEVKQVIDEDYGFRSNKEAVVAWSLKNQHNYDDTKVNSILNKYKESNMLDIEYEKASKFYDNAVKMYREMEQQKMQEQYQKQEAERINNLKQSLQKSVSYFNSLDEIAGVPIGKAEKEAFAKDFEKAVLPDPKTGISPLMMELQSDEVLTKVYWFLKHGDTSFKKTLNSAKETTKNNITDKLFNAPTVATGGSTEVKDYKKEALDAFRED